MALVAETASGVTDIQRVVNRKRDGYVALRADSALTTSYVASGHIDCSQAQQISLYFLFTWVAATSVEYYIEWSYDATTWYRSINSAASAGVNTVTANAQTIAVTAAVNWVDTFDRQAPYMRVLVKRTAGGATDTLAIFAGVTSL